MIGLIFGHGMLRAIIPFSGGCAIQVFFPDERLLDSYYAVRLNALLPMALPGPASGLGRMAMLRRGMPWVRGVRGGGVSSRVLLGLRRAQGGKHHQHRGDREEFSDWQSCYL